MSVSEKIRHRVQIRQPLELFSFSQIVRKDENHSAIAKELSRLYSNGSIRRLKPGVYYKPKESRFGEIKPSEKDVLNFLLFENRKRIGYVSGLRLYNSLGLTSQVSGVIEIASNEKKRSRKFAGLRIRYVKAYGRVNKDDVRLMQLLDAIKDVYNIPGASVVKSLSSLHRMISQLSSERQRELVDIAIKYPPRVKALVGAMMSMIWDQCPGNWELLSNLQRETVNTSRFEYPKIESVLSNTRSWNIHEPAQA